MEIINTVEKIRQQVKKWKQSGDSIGFVPTMGYLHEGHKSLIERAVRENDRVVVSIFVNPVQFGPNEDFDSYPRDLKADSIMCEETGADVIFCPETREMYRENFSTYIEVEGLTGELCGKSRPGHFKGVCTVVNKLFHLVSPDRAYFGEKDAQQLAVIKHMVQDMNMDIEIIGCPIVRETDGLAKSSRNTYLNKEERNAALVLNRALTAAKARLMAGERDCKKILKEMTEIVQREPLARIDYIEIMDGDSIQKLSEAKGNILAAMAVYIGKTRLIDNFIMQL